MHSPSSESTDSKKPASPRQPQSSRRGCSHMELPRRKQKWLYIGWTLTYLLCLLYVAASYRFPDIMGHIFRCPLHELTGLRCPSCGLTRAAMELLHGNPAASIRQNLLIIPIVLLTVIFPVVLVSDLCFGTRLLSGRLRGYGKK